MLTRHASDEVNDLMMERSQMCWRSRLGGHSRRNGHSRRSRLSGLRRRLGLRRLRVWQTALARLLPFEPFALAIAGAVRV